MPDMPGYFCPVEGCGFDIEGRMVSDPDFAAAMDAHVWLHENDLAMGAARVIETLGWTIRYVPYAEDSRTPGMLGQIRGVTDRERREVKIGVKATGSADALAKILMHELRHILDPEWDCGNRDVFGRGGGTTNRRDSLLLDAVESS